MKRWRAIGTPRFAAYLTAREMGGGKTQGLKPLPIPAPSRGDGKTVPVEFRQTPARGWHSRGYRGYSGARAASQARTVRQPSRALVRMPPA